MMSVGKTNKIHSGKIYTGADLLKAARDMMKKQVADMQGRPLTPKEEKGLDQVAQGISSEVLKKMGVV